jgi:hypothetical protein
MSLMKPKLWAPVDWSAFATVTARAGERIKEPRRESVPAQA